MLDSSILYTRGAQFLNLNKTYIDADPLELNSDLRPTNWISAQHIISKDYVKIGNLVFVKIPIFAKYLEAIDKELNAGLYITFDTFKRMFFEAQIKNSKKELGVCLMSKSSKSTHELNNLDLELREIEDTLLNDLSNTFNVQLSSVDDMILNACFGSSFKMMEKMYLQTIPSDLHSCENFISKFATYEFKLFCSQIRFCLTYIILDFLCKDRKWISENDFIEVVAQELAPKFKVDALKSKLLFVANFETFQFQIVFDKNSKLISQVVEL